MVLPRPCLDHVHARTEYPAQIGILKASELDRSIGKQVEHRDMLMLVLTVVDVDGNSALAICGTYGRWQCANDHVLRQHGVAQCHELQLHNGSERSRVMVAVGRQSSSQIDLVGLLGLRMLGRPQKSHYAISYSLESEAMRCKRQLVVVVVADEPSNV